MISTHILDTTLGQPASRVEVLLERKSASGWLTVAKETTNTDGRIVFNSDAEANQYRLTFMTQDYFKRLNQESFFANIEVSFQITNTQRKYHVPLLLSPFSYSTYRGS